MFEGKIVSACTEKGAQTKKKKRRMIFRDIYPVPVYVRRAGERAKVKGLGVTPTHCTLRVVFGLILETGNLYGSVPINQSAVANSAVLIAPPAPYDRESGDGAAMPGSQRHRMHAKV